MKTSILLPVAAILMGAASPAHAADDAQRLGSPCEASAARIVACPKGRHADACVLIGDNEIADRLFLYSADADGKLSDEAPVELVAEEGGKKSVKLDDIEAIEVDGERIWIVASHSRKRWRDEEPAGGENQCAVAGGRLALFVGSWPVGKGKKLTGTVIKTKKDVWRELLRSKCADELFQLDAADAAGRTLAAAACRAFAANDERADQERSACENAFNIEGAAVIPGSDGKPRLWFGLRGPTLEGKALLLRWKGGDAFRFDAIAAIDLGDARGVRDLAWAGGRLWLLAGPTPDSSGVPFALDSVALASLDSGAQLTAKLARSVREQSEGLAILPDARRAVVVTDGEKGESADAACMVPSTFSRVPLD